EMAMLGQLVDRFPAEAVEADAELVTVRAARRLGAGDWDGADSDLQLAEQVAAGLPTRRRRRFEVALATVSLYRARLRGDLDAAERYLDLAMACRPEPAISLTIALTRAVVTHANGDPAAGLEILRGAQQELQRLNGPYVMAASLREWEARLLAATGQVEQARALLSTSEVPPHSSAATLAVRAELQLA